MLRHLTVIVLGLVAMGFTGCNIKTPEIRGVVLDAETKQPVEEAWIHAVIGVKTKTVAGDVGQVISLGPPHLRTGKDGRFVIPSKELKKPLFPVGFGTEVDKLVIRASILDKRGSLTLSKDVLREANVSVTAYVEHEDKLLQKELQHVPPERFEKAKEEALFSGLQVIYNYCLTGRFGIEVPPVEGGCDEWELNYAIAKHERFIKRLGEPKTGDQRSHYAGAMKQLAYLYKQKSDYKKALETFMTVRDFDRKIKMDLWLREYEYQINELQHLLREKEK